GLTWPAAFVAPLTIIVIAGSAVLGLLIGGGYWLAALAPRLADWLKPLQRALFARDVLPTQIILGTAITVCNLAAFAICALAVGVVLPLAAVLAIVPVVLFSMLIPFTVSGWGVREGSAAVLLPLADVAPSAAVASSVMFGIAILIAVLPGLFVAGGK
ncbi:MAG: lysylphosphatidylglycerol synthase domain-containing protein, partial [Ahrensia sp.]